SRATATDSARSSRPGSSSRAAPEARHEPTWIQSARDGARVTDELDRAHADSSVAASGRARRAHRPDRARWPPPPAHVRSRELHGHRPGAHLSALGADTRCAARSVADTDGPAALVAGRRAGLAPDGHGA